MKRELCVFLVLAMAMTISGCGDDASTGKDAAGKGNRIVVVATLDGGGVRDEGFQAAKDAIESNPDLAAIFAINDPSALGAYAALEAAGKTEQVKIIAFDGQLIGKQAILEGKIVCDPIQFPDRIGRMTIQMIVKYFNGEEVPAEVLIPSELYYKEDAEKDPELKAGGRKDSGNDKPADGSDNAPAAGSRGTIGFSALTLTNPFFKVIADNMRDEAAKHGYNLVVVSGERDAKRQADQIDDFIVKGVAAIVLNPCDSKSIGPAIKKANDAGIPVFTNDLAYVGDEGEVVCHIATDNYQGGRLAGQAMVKLLGETGGKIAILHFPQAESCQQRVKGFLEVIDAHNAAPDKPGK